MSLLGGTIIKSGACVVGIRQPLNTPTASDYVKVGSLYWAKGNLIALNNRECKVGAPEDGGVYFQFGSLIGYKGGALANGGTGVGSNPYTGTGTQWWGGVTRWSWANDAMVWPAELSGNPTSWPQATLGTAHKWYFSGQGLTSGAITVTDVGEGVGDPCTCYLGGTWRLPTGADYAAMCNNQTGIGTSYTWAQAGGGDWVTSPINGGNLVGTKLFFPASGLRYTSNGSFYSVTTNGHYWSSSVNAATHGLGLNFNSSWIYPQSNDNRSFGFPARCVSE